MKQAAVSEPIWVSPLEWGGILALVEIAMDFFLSEHFTERGDAAFGCFMLFAPLLIFFLVVKEARDKKMNGSLGFFQGLALAIGTGLIVATVTTTWYTAMGLSGPDMSVAESAFASIFIQMLIYCVFSVICAATMKRR